MSIFLTHHCFHDPIVCNSYKNFASKTFLHSYTDKKRNVMFMCVCMYNSFYIMCILYLSSILIYSRNVVSPIIYFI